MKYFIADAFADKPFSGNPAGVCILEQPLPGDTMQRIANENNLAETAFAVPAGDGYALRWFTPVTEIDLCGHATLASAFVLHEVLGENRASYRFHTKSGPLTVTPKNDLYEMDFPAWPLRQIEITPEMRRAVGCEILEAHLARDLILLLENEETVRDLRPDFPAIAAIPESFGVAVTARGESCDFVSRFFAPGEGIPEDHVTGSLHCMLIPFWAARLGKDKLTARQLSPRGGTLYCENHGARVKIAGRARLYLQGEIFV
ncbi:MAG: PhzF family phenazine biosynthesis protein [Firmicutes bacterium]|nr:PhzF family phenazine biosynthesis protein [Bacillota bacterium]